MTLYQKVLTAYGLIAKSIATKMSEYAVAPEFDPNATYEEGRLVIRGGVLYLCVAPHSGEWDPANFSRSTIDAAIRYSVEKQIEESIGTVGGFAEKTDLAPEFSVENSYEEGDMVVRDNTLYVCTSAHPAGEFDPSRFSVSTVDGALASKAGMSDLPLRMNHVQIVDGYGQLVDRTVNTLSLADDTHVYLTLPPYVEGVARRFSVFIEFGQRASIEQWPGYDSENVRLLTDDAMYPSRSAEYDELSCLFEFVETSAHSFYVMQEDCLAVK